MKLCWIVVLVGISIILVFLYSLVAMSSRTERFIEQLMEEEGRKDTDEQDMEANITEGKERQGSMTTPYWPAIQRRLLLKELPVSSDWASPPTISIH